MQSSHEEQGAARPNEKTRHGCLSAYLIVMMALSVLGALSYLFMSEEALNHNDPELPENIRRPVMAILNVLMGVCMFAIWKWKKWGFWAYIGVGLIAGVLRASLSTAHRVGLIFVVLGSLLLYGALRIGKDQQGWKQLD